MADIKTILEAVDSVMVKIKTVADMPGVSLIPYVSTASSVIGAVHMAYTAGKDITPYVEAIQATFLKPGVPSAGDLATLNARITALEAKVQEPLPPKEAGEPD
jgi:hypothetical protein